MSTRVIQIPSLQPGQEVAVANCVTHGVVVRRLGKNLYLVLYKGHEIEMRRQAIAPILPDGSVARR